MNTTLTTQELSARVKEARTVKEQAEARISAKIREGQEPTELDHAHLKVATDNYFHGVRLLLNAKG